MRKWKKRKGKRRTFNPSLLRWTESITSWETPFSGVTSWTSHSISTLAVVNTSEKLENERMSYCEIPCTPFEISGPIPSPIKSVTVYKVRKAPCRRMCTFAFPTEDVENDRLKPVRNSVWKKWGGIAHREKVLGENMETNYTSKKGVTGSPELMHVAKPLAWSQSMDLW